MINTDHAKAISINYNTIFSCNVQSYNKNHDRIKNLVNQLKSPLIVALQEMWHPKINPQIANYHKPIVSLRKKKKVGA